MGKGINLVVWLSCLSMHWLSVHTNLHVKWRKISIPFHKLLTNTQTCFKKWDQADTRWGAITGYHTCDAETQGWLNWNWKIILKSWLSLTLQQAMSLLSSHSDNYRAWNTVGQSNDLLKCWIHKWYKNTLPYLHSFSSKSRKPLLRIYKFYHQVKN